MSLLWGKDSQVSCADDPKAEAFSERQVGHGPITSCPGAMGERGEAASVSDETVWNRQRAGKPSGLSSRLRLAAQCEKAGSSSGAPRVYSAWIDDFSDDLYQFAEPSYTPKSTFSERVAEIALCGFILLALIGLLAGKI